MVAIVSLCSKLNETNKRITKWSCPFHILQSKSGSCTFSISRHARTIQIHRETTSHRILMNKKRSNNNTEKCWQHENFFFLFYRGTIDFIKSEPVKFLSVDVVMKISCCCVWRDESIPQLVTTDVIHPSTTSVAAQKREIVIPI